MRQAELQIKNYWEYALHRLFDHPSIVLIGGTWKSGKTDFSLKIAEDLKKIHYMGTNLIQEVASNIETFGTYPQISDLISLRQWLYGSNRRKLYIFDEASEHLPSRRAMSRKNVGFIQIIPEISKAHARMIVVGHQLLKIDSQLLDDTWCRGAFLKLELKKAQLISYLMPQPYIFDNIPPTTIKFDPYAIAPFTERPPKEEMFKDADLQKLWDWAHGKSWKELFKHPNECNRFVRSNVVKLLEKTFTDSHT